jgi:hypothetical protein
MLTRSNRPVKKLLRRTEPRSASSALWGDARYHRGRGGGGRYLKRRFVARAVDY